MVLVDVAEGFMLSDIIRERSSRSWEVDVRRRERDASVGEVFDIVLWCDVKGMVDVSNGDG